jgi:hypothetical protein
VLGLSETGVITHMREEDAPRGEEPAISQGVPPETDKAERVDLAHWPSDV